MYSAQDGTGSFVHRVGVRHDTELPKVEYLKPSQVDLLGKVLRDKLLSKDSPLTKRYLNILVDEIVVNDNDAIIKGSYAALACDAPNENGHLQSSAHF